MGVITNLAGVIIKGGQFLWTLVFVFSVIIFVTSVIGDLDIIINTGGHNRFAPKKKDTIRISSHDGIK